MEQNLCRYNSSLHHKNKYKEIKSKSKSRYHDRPCNRMVRNNAIRRQKIKINSDISRNYIVNYIS